MVNIIRCNIFRVREISLPTFEATALIREPELPGLIQGTRESFLTLLARPLMVVERVQRLECPMTRWAYVNDSRVHERKRKIL